MRPRSPTEQAMNEDFFWMLIEQAWLKSPEINERRLTAIRLNRAKQLQDLGDFGNAYAMTIIDHLEQILAMFGNDELTAFIQMFEQKSQILDHAMPSGSSTRTWTGTAWRAPRDGSESSPPPRTSAARSWSRLVGWSLPQAMVFD